MCCLSFNDLTAFGLEKTFQFLFPGQFQLVFGNKETVVHVGDGVFDQGVVFLGAEQQAYRRLIALGHHVLAIPGHIGVELPQVLVSWNEALAYCRFRGGRLPTEAEWERAARGPAGRRYPWGDVFDRQRLNGGRFALDPFEARDGFVELAPVGSFLAGATPDGIHDLAGNVEEWVADWYAPEYPEATEVEPQGPTGGDEKVVRGGGYGHGAAWVRGAARSKDVPSARRAWRGFRCAYAPGAR